MLLVHAFISVRKVDGCVRQEAGVQRILHLAQVTDHAKKILKLLVILHQSWIQFDGPPHVQQRGVVHSYLSYLRCIIIGDHIPLGSEDQLCLHLGHVLTKVLLVKGKAWGQCSQVAHLHCRAHHFIHLGAFARGSHGVLCERIGSHVITFGMWHIESCSAKPAGRSKGAIHLSSVLAPPHRLLVARHLQVRVLRAKYVRYVVLNLTQDVCHKRRLLLQVLGLLRKVVLCGGATPQPKQPLASLKGILVTECIPVAFTQLQSPKVVVR